MFFLIFVCPSVAGGREEMYFLVFMSELPLHIDYPTGVPWLSHVPGGMYSHCSLNPTGSHDLPAGLGISAFLFGRLIFYVACFFFSLTLESLISYGGWDARVP